MGTLYRNGVPYIGSGGAGGVEVTQAEYDSLPESEKLNGSIYFITDGSVSYPTASQMRYDNTESGIPSTSVQGAIDELKIEIGDTDISSIGDGTLSGAVSELNNGLTSVGFSSPEIVTFPFTADRSGMLLVQAGATSSGTGAYIYITDQTLGSQVVTAYNLNGVAINQYYPCVKGHTYAVTYQSNVTNIVHRFFTMGN